ncbi:tautomerase family protein [Catenovulum maritimum]|uniref:Tautomerase n=1 Tax=Catenovulum maritimum TaxID=1513271 RepID=A0A0J8GVC2_9ALTE|nr:4-oxalocrotonate tautomerase family protein [Catenovulum maritimum]KMT66735.1 hypothetical protein XM47_01005 [Catenovulum maritimum]
MPIVTIQITDENVSEKQKLSLISECTDVLTRVLNKDPNTTFVVIDEVPMSNWGIGGTDVKTYRKSN